MNLKLAVVAGVIALGATSASVVEAKGCVKGAIVGGAAGHVAGNHGVAGAAVGCAVGHHREKVKAKEEAAAQQHAAAANSSSSRTSPRSDVSERDNRRTTDVGAPIQ